MVPFTNHSGACSWFAHICEKALTIWFCRLVNCLSQTFGSLSGPAFFQLAILITVDFSCFMVSSCHPIWLWSWSSCSWFLIHWALSLCPTSCSRIFARNSWCLPDLVVYQLGWSSFLVICRSFLHLPWRSYSVYTVHSSWYILWALACNSCFRPSWQAENCSGSSTSTRYLVLPCFPLKLSLDSCCAVATSVLTVDGYVSS